MVKQMKTEQEQRFEENMNLVYLVIHKKFKCYVNNEDVVQVGLIGLWRACEVYDPNKGKFSTIAVFYIKNEILNFLTRDYKKGFCKDSLDEQISNTDLCKNDIIYDETYEIPVDDISSKKIIEDYIKMKDGQARKILQLLLNGYTQKEISDIIGTSRMYVHNVIKEIRTELSIMMNVS